MSKAIFTRDEIIDGYNDRCRVIPAGGQNHAYEAQLACLMLDYMAKAARRRKPARDSRAKPVDRSMERLDRAIADLERTIPDHPGAGPTLSELAGNPGPSAGQVAAQWRTAYAAKAARMCAESEAAYAARNPHKKEQRQ